MSELSPERAYVDLQRLARAQGRSTQQLFELYIHERFRERSGLAGLPERFAEVVDAVVDFIDGAQNPNVTRWEPAHRRWE